MNYAIITNALKVPAEKLVVPQSPRLKPNILDEMQTDLNSAVSDCDTVSTCLLSLKQDFRGHSAFTAVEIAVNNSQGNFAEIAGYIHDLQEYARFWRRLAQKFIGKYEPDRPVIYKPFDEV